MPVDSQTLDRDAMVKLDLERYLRHGEIESLLVGEDEYAVLLQESTTPITKGVAILMTDAGKPHMSHLSLYPLAEKLNGYGWVTLTVNGPDLLGAPPPSASAEQAEDNADESDATPETQTVPIKPIEGFQRIQQPQFDQQQQRLQLAMQGLADIAQRYPGFFLVIGHGTSAAWLSNLYASELLGAPDALIAISPYWPDAQRNNQIPELLATTPAPVLDLYSPWDNEWARQSSSTRRIAAEKALKLHYRQRELIGQPLDQEQFHYMAKEIYGWLSHMGW